MNLLKFSTLLTYTTQPQKLQRVVNCSAGVTSAPRGVNGASAGAMELMNFSISLTHISVNLLKFRTLLTYTTQPRKLQHFVNCSAGVTSAPRCVSAGAMELTNFSISITHISVSLLKFSTLLTYATLPQ